MKHTFIQLSLIISLFILGGCAIICEKEEPNPDPIGINKNGFKVVISQAPETPDASLACRVILIGDAGKVDANDQIMESLGNWGDVEPDKTCVVFLGDNVYPIGFANRYHDEEDTFRGRLDILKHQIDSTHAKKIFVPGNHDWAKDCFGGKEAVLNLQKAIDMHSHHNAEIQPRDARPGPVRIPLLKPQGPEQKGVSLIILDTQWWLNWLPYWRDAKLEDTKESVIEELKKALDESSDDHVILVSHHPLKTSGKHGGYHAACYAPFLRAIGKSQDTKARRYKDMVSQLTTTMSETHPLIYAGGHDHSLQVMTAEAVDYELVSGAGSIEKITAVDARDDTVYARSAAGFMVVDFFRENGKSSIKLSVVEPEQAPYDKSCKKEHVPMPRRVQEKLITDKPPTI